MIALARPGVLAAVLSVIARHGGSVGDIRTVHQSRTSMMRDIDIIMESLAEFDANKFATGSEFVTTCNGRPTSSRATS